MIGLLDSLIVWQNFSQKINLRQLHRGRLVLYSLLKIATKDDCVLGQRGVVVDTAHRSDRASLADLGEWTNMGLELKDIVVADGERLTGGAHLEYIMIANR